MPIVEDASELAPHRVPDEANAWRCARHFRQGEPPEPHLLQRAHDRGVGGTEAGGADLVARERGRVHYYAVVNGVAGARVDDQGP